MEATALPRGGGRIKLRQSIAKSSAVSCRSAHSRLARGRSIGAARNSGKTRPEGRGLSFWDVALIPQASQKFVGSAGALYFAGAARGIQVPVHVTVQHRRSVAACNPDALPAVAPLTPWLPINFLRRR